MFLKRLLKMKKIICMLIMICVMIPLVAACTDAENHLTNNRKNIRIGYGANIEAYTTYAQANLIEMDKDMYYSYLLNGRDFILTVLPKDSDENTPYNKNLMFQAIYNGVTPYSEQIVNGNFSFTNPQYKILIYYITADKFLKWDEDATNKVDGSNNFVSKALDLMGPASNDYEHDVQNRIENYTLKNVVNLNSYISECYFLRTKNGSLAYNSSEYGSDWKRISTKCGSTENKGNVILDVKNASNKTEAGVTLLYSGGGLNGYFTYNDVANYKLEENAPWLNNLINEYGTLTNMITKLTESFSQIEKDELFGSVTVEEYAKQMEYKLKYDLSLLGRISNIKYNTLLDINTTTENIKNINEIKNVDEYKKYLDGNENANKGNYIAFTTAEGFVIERGNIVLQAAADAIFDMNILEQLTNIDACTNRTIASYFAEVLADIGIVVGGLAVGASAIAAVATTLVAVGAVSSSVPVVGWIFGACCLLAAGIATLAVSVSTKKAINETSSANYCEIYADALKEVISGEYIKLPIYHHEIPHNEKYDVTLCYQLNDECGYYKDGEFVKKGTAAFKGADQEEFAKLGVLTGAPSLRLYQNGKVIDEIYGIASTQFLISILDSWGVTASSNMKFFSQVQGVDQNLQTKTVTIYDLLAKADKEDKLNIQKAYYCISEKYEKRCYKEDGIEVSVADLKNNGQMTITTSVDLYNKFVKERENEIKKKHEYSFNGLQVDLWNAVSDNYSKNVQKVEEKEGEHYVCLYRGKLLPCEKYKIVINETYTMLENALGKPIRLENYSSYYTFTDNITNITYKLTPVTDSSGNVSTYKVVRKSIDKTPYEDIVEKMKKHTNSQEFIETFTAIVDKIIDDMEDALDENTIIENIKSGFNNRLSGMAYYIEYIDAYFNITIETKKGDDTSYNTSSNIFGKIPVSLKY